MDTRSLLNPYCLLRLAGLHGEKGAFGLAVLFFLACVVQASLRPSLPWTPEDLLEITKTAEQRLQGTASRPLPIVPYAAIARRNSQPISELSYALATPFNPPLWRRVKRSTPEIFPVRELVASAGRGAFAAAEADSPGEYATRTQGERWVCVTGVVEHQRQTEAFRDALWQASHRDPRKDRPDYVYFRVERTEVDPSRPETIRWGRQNVREMFLRQQSWPHYGTEPVDPRYFPPERSGISFVFPLGPLEDHPWQSEVCHPRIPLSGAALTETSSLHRRGRDNHLLNDVRESTQEPEHLLVRYFDYDVEPGKQYRYRVRLLLANPNQGVPSHRLEDEGSAAVRVLETAWSEPTAVVQVPPDTQALAGAARSWGATVTVMMTRFLIATGEVVFQEFQVRRGQLLDFPQAAAVPSRGRPPVVSSIDFSSGMLLVDVGGGKRMPGRSRLTEPASLLLFDPLGNLVVRNEMDDLPAYRAHQRTSRPPEATYAEKRPALRESGRESLSLE